MLAFALLLAVTVLAGVAVAADTVNLDEIGMRYTPSQNELFVTRNQMDAQALASLGTDSQTMLSSMVRDGLYLVSLLPDGRQFSLGISAKPEGVASGEYADMTAAEKEAFLTQIARKGGYGNAVWEKDGYALFSSTAEAQGNDTLSYADLSLATLYLNNVYTFRMDLIGRQAQQADIDQLLAAAGRTLRLGAQVKAADSTTDAVAETPLTLPATDVESQPAKLTYAVQDCALTLDPIPDTLGVTRLALSGVTVPNGYLRYSVNGKNSSRIKADGQGAFNFVVPTLAGGTSNAIELTAFKGEQKTVVSFSVTVDWQLSPVALNVPGTVTQDGVTVSGLTLPGSTVKLTQGRGNSSAAVGEDGAFSLTLVTTRAGANDFTLQVQAPGYHRNDYAFSITRAESGADAIARLQKKARVFDYSKLTARTAAYANKVVQLSGQVSSMSYADGVPRFVLTTDAGENYAVLCADLLHISQGAALNVLGTLNGTLSDGYPVLTLEALLS